QKDASWDISPSLERTVKNFPLGASEVPIIKSFAKQLHQYVGQESATDTLLGQLALMQHHGAPTRLTDWTHSPYVASFFAIEDATDPNGNSAVWALVESWCKTQSILAIRKKLNLSKNDLPMETDFSTEENLIKYVFNL